MGNVLTVGMATHTDFDGVYFTLQALRAYHGDAFDIVVVDNAPAPCLRTRSVTAAVGGRYYHRPDLVGTSASRDAVFHFAETPWVMVIDSHVLLQPGAVQAALNYAAATPDDQNIHTGPLVLDDGKSRWTHWNQPKTPGLWGTWQKNDAAVATGKPFEIPMMGLGLWFARKESWPGFHPLFRGFGGEEGYIHELYRQRGGKALCHPAVGWRHRFRDIGGWATDPKTGRPIAIVPYRLDLADHVWNLLIGHRELGIDATAQIWEDFGRRLVGGVRTHLDGRQEPLDARAVFDDMVRKIETLQPFGVIQRRKRQRILGVWYSNNSAPVPLLQKSLRSIKAASDQSRHDVDVIGVPWKPIEGIGWEMPFTIAEYTAGPGHLNIVRQIKQGIRYAPTIIGGGTAPYNAVCFLEHDVLYPPDYFDRVGNAFADNPAASVVSNLDYLGLNATGWLEVRERHEPMHQLSMRYEAALANLMRCEDEAASTGQCLLEPQGDRKDWVRLSPRGLCPSVHVNHPNRFTNHGEVVFHQTGAPSHPFWGEHKNWWPGEIAVQPCGSCGKGPPPPPDYPSLQEWAAKNRTADIAEHMPTLTELASKVKRVTELSHWLKSADIALAAGLPADGRFTSVCPARKPQWEQLAKHLPNRFEYIQKDPHNGVMIEETDLLFIDTKHTAAATYDLLNKFHEKVSRYIVIHCTVIYGESGDNGGPGVMPGIRRFLMEQRQWTAIRHDKNNHGLIVLSKAEEDKQQPPSIMRQALNFAKAKVRHIADGSREVSDEVFQQRIELCITCEHRTHDACGACGCPIEAKAAWASEECGLVKLGLPPKWSRDQN